MNHRLADLYRGVAVHATADLEHRAALELLALVMMADTRVEPAEVDTIRGISEDWRDDEFSFEHYLSRLRHLGDLDTGMRFVGCARSHRHGVLHLVVSLRHCVSLCLSTVVLKCIASQLNSMFAFP